MLRGPSVSSDGKGSPGLPTGRSGLPLASDPVSEGQVTVTVGDDVHPVSAAEPFTFGRGERSSACLDPDDVGISRLAGSIEAEGGTWWVVNRSSVRPLTVVDELGIRTVVAPGRRLAVEATVTVVVEGSTRRHALRVEGAGLSRPAGSDQVETGLPTSMGEGVLVNDADRQAMAALFAGYLEDFPRYDPHPRSYADAAARLGWPRTTLVKRIEYLRSRLTEAGVPNLVGENALDHLAEYALTTGFITKADLAALETC